MFDKLSMESVKDKFKSFMPKERASVDVMSEEIDEMTEQNPKKRILNTVINAILIVAIIMAAVCTYVSFVSTSGNGVPSILGVRVFSIQTKSMYPTFEPGDLIFDSAVEDSSELEIGDIITYWTVIDGQRVLNTHRIIQIYDGGGYRIFETQGDNNTIADALTVHESEIVGKYNGKKLDGVGKIFDYLQTSTGFLLVIVIPVAIFFLYHLIQFFRVLFEYNNIKNKLLYEQERGKTEDLVEDEKRKMEETRRLERERLERELRDKLKSEILAANGIIESVSTAPVVEPAVKTEAEKLAEERAAMEARIRAEMEAEAKAKAEAEAEAAKLAAERAEIEARLRAEMEAEAKAKAEAEAEAAKLAAERAAMEARIRAEMEAEARAKAEAEAEAAKLAAERAEMEARIRAEMEAEARAKAEAEVRAKMEAEAKAKAEAERRAAMEAEIRAQIKAEMEAKAKA